MTERWWRRITGADILVAMSVCAFAVLATRVISEPGLEADELAHILPALDFVHPGIETNAISRTGPSLDIGSHMMQVMTLPYAGSLKNLLFVPVAALFDTNAESVRFFTIGLACLALVATYAFACRLFVNKWIAAIGVSFVAIDPGFVFYGRVDIGPTPSMFLLKAIGGWQLLRWWDTRSRLSLVVGGLALGLGTWDKVNFMWIVIASSVAAVVVAGPELRVRLTGRVLTLGIVAFAIGALPLLAYNAQRGFASLDSYQAIGKTLTVFPADVASEPTGGIGAQLVQRLEVLGGLLDGSIVSRLYGMEPGFVPAFLTWIFGLAAAAAAAQVAMALARRNPLSREQRAAAFLLLSGVGTVVAAAATHGGYHGHHVLLVYPIPHLLMALCVVQAARWAGRRWPEPRARRLAKVATAGVLCAIPMVLSGAATVSILDTLADGKARGVWSGEIYALEREIHRKHGDGQVLALDHGISEPLLVLSQGALRVHDWAYPLEADDPGARGNLRQTLAYPGNWYVLHTRDTTVWPRARRRFFDTVRTSGKSLRRVKSTDGRVADGPFEVYAIR